MSNNPQNQIDVPHTSVEAPQQGAEVIMTFAQETYTQGTRVDATSIRQENSRQSGELQTQGALPALSLTDSAQTEAKPAEALKQARGYATTGGAPWKTQIVAPGDTLSKELATHRGIIFDSSMNSVLTTIENMDEASWANLKDNPQYQKELETVLGTYLTDEEMARARESLTKMKAAASYTDAQQTGKRSIFQAIDDNDGMLANPDNIVHAIENMTPADRQKYWQNDPEFKRALDQKIGETLRGSDLQAAKSLLKQIEQNGQKPNLGILENLEMQAEHFNKAFEISPIITVGSRDTHRVLGEVQDAFDRDPALREQIIKGDNPALTQRLDKALRTLLSHRDYEVYGKQLLQTGRLP